MEKIGMFYGTETDKTATVAGKIINEFGKENIEVVSIEKAWKEDFEKYSNLILGTSTWFDGELPSYWDEMISELSSLNLKNKNVAIFGLGDQIRYPENFADGIGILSEIFGTCGANLIGSTSSDGYSFESSRALKNNKFCGLVIDVENQNDKTELRIKEWVSQLKKKFK